MFSLILCQSMGAQTQSVSGAHQQINLEVFTSDTIDETLGSTAWQRLPAPCGLDCGSPTFIYNKVSQQSILKITYQDNVRAAGLCNYQVRVDDQPSIPGDDSSGPILIVSNFGTTGQSSTSTSSTGIFTGIDQGPHVLSFWHRQVAAIECARNNGGFTTSVLVEELTPVVCQGRDCRN